MMAMIGVSFGAVLGLAGWPVLQALGVVNEPVIEVVQRNQADLISRLDATVHVLNAAVAELSARVDSARDRQEAVNQFMTDIDASFGALRRSMHEMREAQNAARESGFNRWRSSTRLPRKHAAISSGCAHLSTS